MNGDLTVSMLAALHIVNQLVLTPPQPQPPKDFFFVVQAYRLTGLLRNQYVLYKLKYDLAYVQYIT